MQLPQPKCSEETNRVKMAGMIRHHHERAIAPHVLVSDNFKTAISAEQSANDQRDERAQSIDEHVRLAGKVAEPLDEPLVGVAG